MKSLERAKSFVASRSASSRGSRPRNIDSATNAAAHNRALKRSNSLCGPHQPAGGSKATKDGQEKTSSAKVLTQLQAYTVEIDQMLHSLQELSESFQRERIKVPRLKNCSNCEHNAIMKLVVEIETKVKIARNSLLFLCRCYLQERHIAVLLSIQSQIYPTLDISVRFFGIDWLHIFRVSYNLQQCVEDMAQLVVNGTSTTAFADILLPSNVLRGLATIEADVSFHAEAVLHGRLSKITQEKIHWEQQQRADRHPLEEVGASTPKSEKDEGQGQGEELAEGRKEAQQRSGRRQMISDLRRKLRKAIRILPGSKSMHGLSTATNTTGPEKVTGLIDKRSRSHHDALWKAWYTGVQTVTIPFSSTSLRSQTTDSPTSSPHPASSISAVYAISSVEDPSQPQVLGDVVHHYQCFADSIETIDGIAAEEEVVAAEHHHDESFDSLTLTLTMATAPKQECQESQL